jgi:uncharacterized protein
VLRWDRVDNPEGNRAGLSLTDYLYWKFSREVTMRNILFLLTAAGVLLFHPLDLRATSFDCSKNLGPVEKAICSDKRLSGLDDQLADAYKRTLAAAADKNGVKAEQVKWLKSDRDRCRDNACIEAAYLRRLSQLQQPAQAQTQPAPAAKTGAPGKSPSTAKDREAWYAILKWPAECEESFRDISKDTAGSGLKFYPLSARKYLVEVLCDRAAYQEVFVFMLYDEETSSAKLLKLKQYDLNSDGSATVTEESEVAGMTEFNEKNKTLKIFAKARGLGDCGSLVTYGFDSGAATVVEARAQACSDNPSAAKADPEKWKKLK